MPDVSGPLGPVRGIVLGGATPEPPRPGREHSWADVPWRTIVASVGVVLATYVLVQIVLMTVQVIAWISIAAFAAVVLAPAVSRVQARVGGRRGLATGIVVLSTLAVVIGVLSVFLLPVRNQLIDVITDLPGTIRDAAAGRGTFGRLVTRLHLNNYVQEHEVELRRAADRLSSSSFELATALISGLIAFVTITVVTFFLLSQSSALGKAVLGALPRRRRESVKRVALDAGQAISGYMVGNLLISLIAGATTFVCLLILGVPAPFVLAVWVAFVDLIPLVGAILGAVVVVGAGFLHSTTAGIVTLVFFVVYQQLENSVIYPAVMARRVKANPLVVLLSFLLGVTIFGWIGALLAVPVSGAALVAMKSIQHERQQARLTLTAVDESAARHAG
ncbi:MAG: AI-2E family transporter [Ilumatobacteraceae bacterium]